MWLLAVEGGANHDLLIVGLISSALVFLGVVTTGFIGWSNNRIAQRGASAAKESTAVAEKAAREAASTREHSDESHALMMEVANQVSNEILAKLDTGNAKDIGNTVHDMSDAVEEGLTQSKANARELLNVVAKLDAHIIESEEVRQQLDRLFHRSKIEEGE